MIVVLTHSLFSIHQGADFLLNHIVRKTGETWRCYFSVTRDGKPVHRQRKLFAECFYTMAFSELARATGDKTYKVILFTYFKGPSYVMWLELNSSFCCTLRLLFVPHGWNIGLSSPQSTSSVSRYFDAWSTVNI